METMLEIKTIPFNLKNPQELFMQRNRTVSNLLSSLELLSNQLYKFWVVVTDEYIKTII